MTTTTIREAVYADGVADLAVANPAHDLCLEHTLSRLDGALDRILARLTGHLSDASVAQLGKAATLLTALPPAARRQVLSHPYYMYWLVKQHERCVSGDREGLEAAMLDIGRFVVIPALLHGVWQGDPIIVRSRAGQLRFPGHPHHILIPAGAPDAQIELRLDSEALRVKGRGCDIFVPVDELHGLAASQGGSPLASRPTIPGTGIEVDGTDPFVGELYSSMNARPPLPNYPPRDLAAMPYVQPEVLGQLAAACDLIAQAWPAASAEFRNYTKLFVPFVSRCYSTFAEAAFLGAVFMGESRHSFTDVMFTAEHLLHEHSHLRLHLIMEQDPIFDGDGGRLVVSPWRRDMRPIIGIVQGVFVFARVARLLRHAYDLFGDERFAIRRTNVAEDVRSGMRVLREAEISFTPLGSALFEQCGEEAAL